MDGDQALETGEIPEEIQSFHESQESRTTEGKQQNREEGALREEQPLNIQSQHEEDDGDDAFQLEADSEEEEV